MVRTEIIANQSIQDELIENLEEYIPDILYTYIPVVHGRGKNARKLGDATWPETNFILVSYVSDSQCEIVKKVITALKEKFPGEGIKLFIVNAVEFKS
ncbi:MAG: hypothetical protein MJ169_02290 [Treponema sp.]|nr:hypothetical protein [Treponema sp.]